MNDDLKAECHKYLDMLWTTKEEREQAYKWLAKRLKIPLKRCHISMLCISDLYKARHILRQKAREKRKRELK